MTRLQSFSNLKSKSKQDLQTSIRTLEVDTATNILIAALAPQPQQHQAHPPPPPPPMGTPHKLTRPLFTPRLFSLTNNRYQENAANIVRLEHSLYNGSSEAVFHRLTMLSDLNPLSLLNYNLTRSNSNTPQTLVLMSESNTDAVLRHERSPSPRNSGLVLKTPDLDQNRGLLSVLDACGSLERQDGEVSRLTESEISPHASPVADTAALPNSEGSRTRIATPESEYASAASQRSVDDEPIPVNITAEGDGSVQNTLSDFHATPLPAYAERSLSPAGNALQSAANLVSADDREDNNSAASVDGANTITDLEGDIAAKFVGPSADSSASTFILNVHDQQILPAIVPPPAPASVAESTEQDVVTVPPTDPCTSSGVVHSGSLPSVANSELPEPTIPLESASTSTQTKVNVPLAEQQFMNDIGVAGSTTLNTPKSTAPPSPISKDNTPVQVSSSSSPPTPITKDDHHRRDHKGSSTASTAFAPIMEDDYVSRASTLKKSASQKVRSLLLDDTPASDKAASTFDRKNPGLSLTIDQAVAKEVLPDAPTPISKDSPVRKPNIPQSDSSRTFRSSLKSPISDFSFLPGEENLAMKLPHVEMHTSGQINLFLQDDQPEVPERRDLHVRGDMIKVHKRNTSSISSAGSFRIHLSPRKDGTHPKVESTDSPETMKPTSGPGELEGADFEHELPPLPDKALTPVRDSTPVKNKRSSLLDVVDVNFDEALPPPSVRKDQLLTGRFSLLGDPLISPEKKKLAALGEPSPVLYDTVTEQLSDNVSTLSSITLEAQKQEKKKKIFRLFRTELRSEDLRTSRKLSSKVSLSSLKDGKKSRLGDSHRSLESEGPIAPKPEVPRQNKKLGRRNKFFLNLKLASASKLKDLPSPVYSVREKASSPVSLEPLPKAEVKYDLPTYEVENDDFDDILLKFDEVEKEAELEAEQHRLKPKGDFFLKDDELTKAQIADQQRNDNQHSDESLPRKFDEEKPGSPIFIDDGVSWGQVSPEANKEYLIKIGGDETLQHLVLNNRQLAKSFNENPDANYPLYLKHLKQFQDVEQLEIWLEAFNPFEPHPAPNTLSITSSPILKAKVDKSSKKSVKFSKTVYMSETYPSYMYKRYNKSVTQYYLTETGEVNKIKNELNAYKCHEMLVHEKSQVNTQFFY